jgi:hypothetical protein
MKLHWSCLRPLIAAICVAPLVALAAQAQAPKKMFSEGEIYGRSIADSCADIWTIKDRQQLKDVEADAIESLQRTVQIYTDARTKALKDVQEAEREVERLNDAMVASSLAEGHTWEKAGENGVMSKEQVKALGASLWNTVNRAGRDQAETRLQTARTILNGVNRRLTGWYVFAIGVGECIRDQAVYLEKTNPNSPLRKPNEEQPLGTAPDRRNIQTAQGSISGIWSATCHYDNRSYPVDGRFSMQLDGNKRLVAGFVDGQPASVTGSVLPSGQVNGTGTVTMPPGMPVLVTINGTVARGANGALFGGGSFTSSNNSGMKCNGRWNG